MTAELARPITTRGPGSGATSVTPAGPRMPWPHGRGDDGHLHHGPAGLAAGLSDDVRTVLGREPIDFATFAHRERATWLPDPTRTTENPETRNTMKIALIGATGRTGAHVLTTALDHGHDLTVLVRDPAKLPAEARDRVRVVVGDATDPGPLADLIDGADTVVSALGPTGREGGLHTRTARALVDQMTARGPRRFVGVSAAGIDVPGDRKARRDKLISWLLRTIGGETAKDKPAEYAIWAASGLDWTPGAATPPDRRTGLHPPVGARPAPLHPLDLHHPGGARRILDRGRRTPPLPLLGALRRHRQSPVGERPTDHTADDMVSDPETVMAHRDRWGTEVPARDWTQPAARQEPTPAA